jgi:hypothetical protein
LLGRETAFLQALDMRWRASPALKRQEEPAI